VPVVPVPADAGPMEREHILRDSGAELLIGDPEWPEVTIDRVPIPATGSVSGWVDVADSAPALIMYTSGTTGLPKGAMITHGMNFWNCVNLGIPAGIGIDTVHLNVLPLFHTGGLNCYCNPVLHAGGTVVNMKAFDPSETLRVLGDPEQGITHFFGVPAPYQFMMQHPDFGTTDLSRLRVAGVGGAPCALAIMEAWFERGVPLLQGFGMTETSPACIFLDPSDALRKIGSTGKALMHTEFRIVNDDGGDCGPDEVGELWVAGPHITPGYWNKPEASETALSGGHFHSGDVGYMDEDGYTFIVDRLKEMILAGGYNVYPREIDEVLYGHPAVLEAAVVAKKDEHGLVKPKAYVRLKKGHRPSDKLAKDIQLFVKKSIAPYKFPRWIEFVKDLPKTSTGKIQR